MEIEVIQLELKYCERCGGLWLRRRGLNNVCCWNCAREAPDFLMLRKPRRKRTLPVTHNGGFCPQAVAGPVRTGGNA